MSRIQRGIVPFLIIIAVFIAKNDCGTNTITKTEFLEWLMEEYFKTNDSGTISEAAFEKILTDLKIGSIASQSSSHHDHGHQEQHQEQHQDQHQDQHQYPRGQGHSESVETCLSGERLLSIYNINHSIGLTKSQFMEMCPALLQQQISGSCSKENTTGHKENEHGKPTDFEMYGYGTIAVAIITVTSIAGLFVFPCMHKKLYQYVMMALISLAVGTLCGDAILHLIPHALNLHAHEHGASGEQKHLILDEFVWKMTVVVGAIYGFFVLELILGGHSHSHDGSSSDEHDIIHSTIPRGDTFDDVSEIASRHGSFRKKKKTSSTVQLTNIATSIQDIQMQSESPDQADNRAVANGDVNHVTKKKSEEKRPIKSVAYMVLIGDGIHNFADGLAIGAAFSFSTDAGVATSIAVFCHELPHEFGDFAVLLKSGFTFKKALFCNFVSSLVCFAGLYLGIAIALDDSVRMWIFVVVAGMFLYVSLADMLPEVVTMTTDNFCLSFIVQNIGILTGFALMLVIAIFEEYIDI